MGLATGRASRHRESHGKRTHSKLSPRAGRDYFVTVQNQLTVVPDYGDHCGEAPLWDARSQTLSWLDCVGLTVYRYHPGSARRELLMSGIEANGLSFDNDDGFIITNNSSIWFWDGADKLRLIADTAEVRSVR
jgi:sugar lactone lactonase YvrE